MRIAYFDTIAGISGDMTLGAFVSAGVPLAVLSGGINKLPLDGIELQASHVVRSGISAVKVDVVISAGSKHGRHLADIFNVIDGSTLPDRVKENSKKIFMEVARAEATVHNSTIEKIHFHEVGAIDSIVDIVGTAICLDFLDIGSVFSSPVKVGSGGFTVTEHGKLPVPVPATVEILRGYTTVLTDIPFEITTPTGAAIIKALSSGILEKERIKVQSIGYGAGARELQEIPNLLRIMVGELSSDHEHDEIIVVETNIDDMNPEIYPHVIERLMEAGAHDAFLVPIIMKKGRPGSMLSVIADHTTLDGIVGILFAQTTTLGVRMQTMGRRVLHRSQREIDTPLGKAKMKVVIFDGAERMIPEFEECKRLATEAGLPLLEVYKILEHWVPGIHQSAIKG